MNGQTHCIIIGAGIAGITAAVALAERKVRVTLLDARAYPGGRVRSFADKTSGEIIDNGQHLLMGCYKHSLNLLETLGTRNQLQAQRRLRVAFAEADGRQAVLDSSLLPGKLGMAAGIARLQGLSFRDKMLALRLAARLRIGWLRSKNMSAEEFLRRHKQSESLIRRLWEPIILATLNARPDQAAASLFVTVLQLAFFADEESARLLFPRRGLSELLAPLPDWLAAKGGALKLHTTVRELLLRDDKVRGVILNDGSELSSDIVISALPARSLGRVIPAETAKRPEFRALQHCKTSPIISVYLWFDRSFLATEFTAMLGSSIQWVFNRRALCETAEELRQRYPGHVALTVSAADDIVNASSDAIIDLALRELRAAFPAARAAKLLHGTVIKEKSATFLATAAFEPLRPSPLTGLQNFVLAGDWTDTWLPATIEGAALSGIRAAREVMRWIHYDGAPTTVYFDVLSRGPLEM